MIAHNKKMTEPYTQKTLSARTRADLGVKLQEFLHNKPHIISFHFVADPEETILMVSIANGRQGKFSRLKSFEQKESEGFAFPRLIRDLPARQDGSVVVTGRIFRVPISKSEYLEITLEGRSRDPGDRL
jgi:hypothetical protein